MQQRPLDEEYAYALRPRLCHKAPEQSVTRTNAGHLRLQPIRRGRISQRSDFELELQPRPTGGGKEGKQKAEEGSHEHEGA